MNINDIIENIKNDYYRKLIKNIFSKLDDEEKYVILELNNQLQEKINKIDKAIEYIKTIKQHYEELKKPPFEDSVFINDMLRQSFITTIQSFLELLLEDLGGNNER